MTEQIKTWTKIGNENLWIRESWDPPFNESSFAACDTIEDLAYQLGPEHCWCLGTAFYFENIAFINQVNGGNEWLVIRDDVSFESLSGSRLDLAYFTKFVADVQAATPEQLRKLDYVT